MPHAKKPLTIKKVLHDLAYVARCYRPSLLEHRTATAAGEIICRLQADIVLLQGLPETEGDDVRNLEARFQVRVTRAAVDAWVEEMNANLDPDVQFSADDLWAACTKQNWTKFVLDPEIDLADLVEKGPKDLALEFIGFVADTLEG